MTHAALQDRLALVRDALKPIPWAKGESGNPSMSDTVQEAIAALSAMEGEAVHGVKFATVRATDGEWLDIECRFADGQKYAAVQVVVEQDGLAHAIAAFLSAPPPQQADCPHDAWEVTASGAYHETRDCADCGQHLGRFARQDDNPTPSPGPQGGGDAVIRNGVAVFTKCATEVLDAIAGLSAIRDGKTLFETDPSQSDDSYSAWMALNHGVSRLRECVNALQNVSTPPQPEAQVSDAMVAVIHRHCGKTSSLSKYILDDLTAALTTSGRDGDGTP